MKRRTFLENTSRASLALGLGTTFTKAKNAAVHSTGEVRPITSGKKQHWFGYYDKWQI